MKRIIITGANGFIGSNLYRSLRKRFAVIALVRKESDISLLPPDSNIIRVDYSDYESLRSIISTGNCLIHCAALTRAKNWETMKRVNLDLTEKIVEIINQAEKVEQFVFISSQAAAGMSTNLTPKTENERMNPITNYGKSKKYSEILIKKRIKVPYTIIRPASVFGEGDKDFLSLFKLINRGFSIIIGLKDHYFSLIYINDLINIISKSILNDRVYNTTFFASNDLILTYDDFYKLIAKIMQINTKKIKIPSVMVHIVAFFNEILSKYSARVPLLNLQKAKELTGRFWLCSNLQNKKLLNYEYDNNINKNIKNTLDWYKENKWL